MLVCHGEMCKKPRSLSKNDPCQQVQTPDLTSHNIFSVTARVTQNTLFYWQNFKWVFIKELCNKKTYISIIHNTEFFILSNKMMIFLESTLFW